MNTPSISAIIPCYNNGAYIGQAIESVLTQGDYPIEVIVVDDGSTDDSAEVAARFEGVTVLRQPNRGASSARNRGIAAATGDVVAFLDADDYWAPGKLTCQLEVMSSAGSTDVVYGSIEEFVSEDLPAAERSGVTARPGRQTVLLPSTLLLTRRALDEVGEFEVGDGSGEAIDWILRVNEAGLTVEPAPDALTYRRIHASNTGRRNRAQQHATYLAAIKRSLQRRRTAPGAPR